MYTFRDPRLVGVRSSFQNTVGRPSETLSGALTQAMAASPSPLREPLALFPKVAKTTPRKLLRILFVVLVFLGLVIHLSQDTRPEHHAPFDPPDTRIVVHGDPVNGLPQPPYPLEPFPYSPMQSTTKNNSEPLQPKPWLAAVISSAGDAQRRYLIRSSWMSLYRDVPFDGRFVVANPGPQWTGAVAKENRTFGDMIVLDHIAEDDVTANTIKTLEFYKWLVEHGPRRYEFVSKMDTDLWFNARGFWERFLLPKTRKDAATGQLLSTVNRTIFGELYYSKTYDLVFPHGAMYTASWDTVALLASLQERFKVVTGEDMATAILLLKGREQANFVNFRGTEKFDYDEADTRGDGTAWARQGTHPNSTYHALVGSNAIAVHQLKSEDSFLKVAECFDEQGIKVTPLQTYAETWRPRPWLVYWHDFWTSIGLSGQYDSRFQRIPDFLWTQRKGSWICDGIWNLGKTKEGYSTQ